MAGAGGRALGPGSATCRFDRLIYGFLTAGTFAWLWPK
jgi:hypothetical protein